MSLILYYRDCFTADTAINDELNTWRVHYENRPKTYLSEDKRFAAMACGMVPDEKGWNDIRDAIDLYILSKENDIKDHDKVAVEKLKQVFEHKFSTSSLIVATGNYLLTFIYRKSTLDTIESHNPDIPFVTGSGEFAARVLINSENPLSQKQFFNIVSLSDKQVSRDYTFIELKDVIGTPWHKKYSKDKKK